MRETWSIPGVRKIPRRRREMLPTPVFWPGEFHGLYSPWGRKESDTTERLSLNSSTWLSRCSISSPGQLSNSTGNCPCQPSPGFVGPYWVTVTEQRLSSFLSIPVLAHFQDQSTHVPNTPAPRGSALSNLLSAAALCSFRRV